MIINPDYKQQLQDAHKNPKWMKGASGLHSKIDKFLIEYTAQSVMDFGCSQGGLIKSIKEKYPNITVAGYDPGIPEYEVLPNGPFDVIVSTDVLEHVEYEYINDTLKQIGERFTKACYLIIASYPAKKKLPDGRNAHIIIESFDWWKQRLEQHITGTIVQAESCAIYKTPKKGPAITGEEFLFVIEKF